MRPLRRRVAAGSVLSAAVVGTALALGPGAPAEGQTAPAPSPQLLDAVIHNVSESPLGPSNGAAVAGEGDDTYVAWREGDDIAVRAVRGHGLEPGPVTLLDPPGDGRLAAEGPSIAAVGDTVYVVWAEGAGAPAVYETFLAVSHDRGATFGPPEQLSDDGGDPAYRPKVAASEDVVAVAWEGRASQVVLATSDGAGGRWELDLVGRARNGEYEVAAELRRVHVAWIDDAVYSARMVGFGSPLEAPVELGGRGHLPHHPDLAVDGDDVAVGWIEYAGDPRFHPIVVAESADAGTTFARDTVNTFERSCRAICGGPGPELGIEHGRVHAFFGAGDAGVQEAIMDGGRLLQLAPVGNDAPSLGTVTDALVTDNAVVVTWTRFDETTFRAVVHDAARRHGSNTWALRSSNLGGIAWDPRLAPLDGDYVVAWNELHRDLGNDEVLLRPASFADPDLAVLGVEAVQAAQGAVDLVAGKPTALRARVRNGFGVPQTITARWVVDNAGTVTSFDQELTLRPGVQTISFVPAAPFEVADGTLDVSVTLDSTDVVEETDEANNLEGAPQASVSTTRPHHVLYVPLDDGGMSTVPCRSVEILAASTQPFLDAVWPADPDASQAMVSCAQPAQYVRKPGGGKRPLGVVLAELVDQFEQSLLVWDQIVVVVPPGWIPANIEEARADTVGISNLHGSRIVFADQTGWSGVVATHELTHDTGWVLGELDPGGEHQNHLLATPAPGYWVARGQDMAGRADYMAPKTATTTFDHRTWISVATWDHLLARQSASTAGFAAASSASSLSIHGAVLDDGTVEAGAWQLVDAPPTVGFEPGGDVELVWLGAGDEVLATGSLPLSVVGDGDPALSTGRSFSARVPIVDGTEALEVRVDGTTVLRRERPATTPTIAVTADATAAPGGSLGVSWTATGAVAVDLEVSADGGATWLPAGAALTGTSTAIAVPATTSGELLVRATATDGWHAASDLSDPVEVVGGTGNGRIAFGTGEAGGPVDAPGTSLWVAEADGSDPRLLVDRDDLPADFDPSIRHVSWSPSGRRLAFDLNDRSQLFVVGDDGRGLRSLGLEETFASADRGPATLACTAWSPDGTRIAFAETGYGLGGTMPLGSRLWTIEVDVVDAEPQLVADGLVGDLRHCPSTWVDGPDGERLLLLSHAGLETVRPDGSDRSVVVPMPDDGVFGADLSADGTQVAFITRDGRGRFQVFVADLVDGSTRQLTDYPGLSEVPAAEQPQPVTVTWAPDGRSVLVDVRVGAMWPWTVHLEVVDALSGERTVLPLDPGADHHEPDWEPVTSDPVEAPAPLPAVHAVVDAPASVAEGSVVELDASASSADEGIVAIGWDLDGDGTFGDAEGETASVVADDDGPLTVAVEVVDGVGQVDLAVVTVEVTETAPVVESAVAVERGGSVVLDAVVRSAPADAVTAAVGWGTASVVPAGGGRWLVTAVGPAGPGEVRLDVTDDDGSTATATVPVTSAPANQAPTLAGAAVHTPAGVPVEVDVGVADADGPVHAVQLAVVGGPGHGTVSTIAGPMVLYTPDAGFTGTDTFTVEAFDGAARSARATVTVTVGAAAPPPPPPPPAAPAPEPAPAPPDPSPAPGGACPPEEVPAAPFADVPADSVHAPSIACLVWRGIASGTGPGTYDPAGSVTRGQLASFLDRLIAASGVAVEEGSDTFGDDDGLVHEPAIDRLANAGVLVGVAPGRFDPAAPVSRAQLASLLASTWRFVTGAELPEGGDAFADDDGIVHESAIDRLAAAGLAKGVTDDAFAPSDDVRRDQLASFLVRFLARTWRPITG